MNDEYRLYKSFVKEILERVPAIRTEQLRVCLMKKYKGLTYSEISRLFNMLQFDRVCLHSEDGWTMTEGAYLDITRDRFFDKINVHCHTHIVDPVDVTRLPVRTDIIDCLWIAADMIPGSQDFVLGLFPWYVQYIMPEENGMPARLFQITRIHRGEGAVAGALLSDLPQAEEESVRMLTRRIAVVDTAEDAKYLPYLGFSHVTMIDHSAESHYRILDNRIQAVGMKGIWRDYRKQ